MLSKNLNKNIEKIKKTFPVDNSFDYLTRNLIFGDVSAYWIGINGLCNVEYVQAIFSDLQNPLYNLHPNINDIERYMNSKIGYGQAEVTGDWNQIVRNILSGPSALFIDGFDKVILIDSRMYPTRSMVEPDSEQVTRGAKDGFVETLVYNTALIRRRIRNPKMTFELESVGTDSKTDVAIAYISDIVDKELLNELKQKINEIKATSLTMGSKSLEELLVEKRILNPLPNVYSTERPDVACSYIMEGYIVVLVDNSPDVLVFPCTIFQFTQSPEDYYKNPAVGNYIRFTRFLCVILSLFALPVFMLIEMSKGKVIELFVFVLIIELFLDLFKYSSAHSPTRFSNSLSIVGGLIIGDIAVEMNWVSKDVLFYGAATMLATLSLVNIEFGEAMRLYRLFLIVLTGLFGMMGFVAGCIFVIISVITTPSFGRKSYFWPVCPFNKEALKKILFRCPTFKAQPSKVWHKK